MAEALYSCDKGGEEDGWLRPYPPPGNREEKKKKGRALLGPRSRKNSQESRMPAHGRSTLATERKKKGHPKKRRFFSFDGERMREEVPPQRKRRSRRGGPDKRFFLFLSLAEGKLLFPPCRGSEGSNFLTLFPLPGGKRR